ncbi:MAG: glycosyltransferase family 2 protein [Eubacteriales bacterium]|nr:glycosyltransferase family 2 protein [Eubacteriales bacterium]
MNVDCSVGIVTYNSERTIEKTLRALLLHWPAELSGQIIVIDNGSTDQTLAIVKQLGTETDRIKVVLVTSTAGNCGYGEGHNQALPLLQSTVHLIMNPDIAIQNANSIRALFLRLTTKPEVGLVMPKIIDTAGQTQYLARRDLTVIDLFVRYLPGRWFANREAYHAMRDHDYDQPFAIEFASGCLMAMRTADFRAIGGFDPRYFLYAEDADLSRTVRSHGYTVWYDPTAVVEHAWERGSYRSFRMFFIHFKSLWQYFHKWGFRLL